MKMIVNVYFFTLRQGLQAKRNHIPPAGCRAAKIFSRPVTRVTDVPERPIRPVPQRNQMELQIDMTQMDTNGDTLREWKANENKHSDSETCRVTYTMNHMEVHLEWKLQIWICLTRWSTDVIKPAGRIKHLQGNIVGPHCIRWLLQVLLHAYARPPQNLSCLGFLEVDTTTAMNKFIQDLRTFITALTMTFTKTARWDDEQCR